MVDDSRCRWSIIDGVMGSPAKTLAPAKYVPRVSVCLAFVAHLSVILIFPDLPWSQQHHPLSI